MDRQEKIEIINYYEKNDFHEFLEHDHSGRILQLLDDEGIDILRNSPKREDRINYILSFSPYLVELFKNNMFLDMFLKTDIGKYYAVLDNLDFNSCNNIMNMAFELRMENHVIAKLFNNFSTKYKLHVIEKWPYSEKLLYDVMESGEFEVLKCIIENYNIDLTKYSVNIEKMFGRFKEISIKNFRKRNEGNSESVVEISFPSRMFDEKLAEVMWKKYDIYKIRMLINDSEYFTDPGILNDYVRRKENMIINSCNDYTIVYPFNELYNKFYNMMEAYKNDDDDFIVYRKQYTDMLKIIDDDNLHDELKDEYNKGGYDAAKIYLQGLGSKCISNYIIDYNFLENYHNVMIDIKELLHFYDNGNIDIPKERIDIYRKISGIDSLSIEEKKELHIFLKKYNIVQTFYDDMSFARKVVNSAIKDYSLTKNSLEKYKDEELSKQYGVPVYKMDNKPFFGIVKSGQHDMSELPMGRSYSLIGNNGLTTFGQLAYLYDSSDLNPEQIVHVFPYDSFTSYHPFENMEEATERVYTLMMPDELVGSAPGHYNELLVLEQGKKQTDIDKDIPRLRRIALYCVDQITNMDIDTAKKENVGIMLVSADKCKIDNSDISDKYRHIQIFGYDYFKYNRKNEYDMKR